MIVYTHGVEGGSVNGLVYFIGTSDGVRGEERDNLKWSETTGILEASKDRGDAVLRLRDQANDSRDSRIGTAGQELNSRSTLKMTLSEFCCTVSE